MNPSKMNSSKLHLALGLTGLAMTAGSVNAATVLIDWSTATNISGLTNGYYWNSLGSNANVADPGTDVATTNLIDSSTGLDSGYNVTVDITYTGTSTKEGAAFGGNAIAGTVGADPFDEVGATTDGLFANYNSKGTAVITFTDLTALTQYNFVAIGGRASGGNDGLISVLQGTSGFSSYTLANSGALLSFSVTSTAGGVIELDFSEGLNDTSGTTNSTWNAMSITQVPEPSATLLGGLGMLALLRRRR